MIRHHFPQSLDLDLALAELVAPSQGHKACPCAEYVELRGLRVPRPNFGHPVCLFLPLLSAFEQLPV